MLSGSLKVQAVIGFIAVVVFAFQGLLVSALYGFLIGILNILMLGLTFKKANNKASESPQTGIMILYMSAVVRFVLLAVLFVLGLSLLSLEPVSVVLTFVLMQVGQVFNLAGKRRLTD